MQNAGDQDVLNRGERHGGVHVPKTLLRVGVGPSLPISSHCIVSVSCLMSVFYCMHVYVLFNVLSRMHRRATGRRSFPTRNLG